MSSCRHMYHISDQLTTVEGISELKELTCYFCDKKRKPTGTEAYIFARGARYLREALRETLHELQREAKAEMDG
jgi:hypothetical protein